MLLNISVTILLYILFINVATFNGQDVVNSIDEEKLLDTKPSIDSKSKGHDVVVREVPMMDSKGLEAVERIGWGALGAILNIGKATVKGTQWLVKWIKGKKKG